MTPTDVSDWERVGGSSGTKEGVWLIDPRTRRRGLVKVPTYRAQHDYHEGENWAESLASKLGHRLTVSVPAVDIVSYKNLLCPISWDIRPYGWELREGVALASVAGLTEPLTLDQVVGILAESLGDFDARRGVCSMVLFDILTGNCDRHWYNWGVLLPPQGSTGGAPMMAHLYDNGSSLGSNLMRDRLQQYLVEPAQRQRFDYRYKYEIRVDPEQKPGPLELLTELYNWDHRLFGFLAELECLTDLTIDELVDETLQEVPTVERADFSRLLLKRRRRLLLEREVSKL